MKSTIVTIFAFAACSVLWAKDFTAEPFTVTDIENWLTFDLSIEGMEEAFGENSMKLRSLELIEPNDHEDDETYGGTERYVYVLQNVGEEGFKLGKNWSLNSPSISFRFSGLNFIEAFIMNPKPENLIRLKPRKSPENQSVDTTPISAPR